jgi:RND family efflux transporter MFP subunit
VVRGAALAAAIAVAAVGPFGLTGCSGKDPSAAAPARYAQPERRTVAASVLATGIVRLKVGAEVRVGSQLSGIVEELNVTVGSKIEAGDVIARIDSRGLEARLAQARAQIAVIEQEVRRAEIELARARELDQQNLIARTDVEDRALALAEAQARLAKARRDAEVVATDLSYAEIRSPISGTIASVATQEGETVAASFTTPTFVTIIDDDALELIAMVDETDIGNVAVSNPVRFTVESFPLEEFEGQVARIAPKGSIISGVVNFEVMIDIQSPSALLKPDMTANVSIQTAERQALVLPRDAVQRAGSQRFVYVERDGQLARRPVTVGTREAGVVEILQGVSQADRVLVGEPPADMALAGGESED